MHKKNETKSFYPLHASGMPPRWGIPVLPGPFKSQILLIKVSLEFCDGVTFGEPLTDYIHIMEIMHVCTIIRDQTLID